jgi:MYXO-CTERM domain-containing protein
MISGRQRLNDQVGDDPCPPWENDVSRGHSRANRRRPRLRCAGTPHALTAFVRLLPLAASFGLAVSILTACSALPGESEESTRNAVAVSGRWRLPGSVATAGARARLKYDGAPNWSSRACAGKLMSGADRLGDFLQREFSGVRSVGGYACRTNTANRKKMSVHGTGRALDVFIPKAGGLADNTKGDAVANWLVTNATRIGVQMVIWDRTVWMANGSNDKPYTGPHPHDDHLHVELTIPAASMQTPWFNGAQGVDPEEVEPDPGPTRPSADAGAPGRPDASAPEPEPTPEPEPEPEPDPGPDEPEPPPPTEGEATPDTEPAPAGSSDGFPDEGVEESLQDEEPEEDETVEPSSKSSKRSGTEYDAIASSGCSSAPSGAGDIGTAPLALVVAAALVRRRRRA